MTSTSSDLPRRGSAATPDPTATSIALRYGEVAASNELDPVGRTLVLTKDFGFKPLLQWEDASDNAYHVLRCDASSGPCDPGFHDATPLSSYTDRSPPATADLLWYKVQAVNECAGGL